MDGDESEEGIVDYLKGATVGVGGEDVEAVTEAVDGVELGEAGLTPFCRPLSVMLMKRWSTVVTYQSLLWRQKCRKLRSGTARSNWKEQVARCHCHRRISSPCRLFHSGIGCQYWHLVLLCIHGNLHLHTMQNCRWRLTIFPLSGSWFHTK